MKDFTFWHSDASIVIREGRWAEYAYARKADDLEREEHDTCDCCQTQVGSEYLVPMHDKHRGDGTGGFFMACPVCWTSLVGVAYQYNWPNYTEFATQARLTNILLGAMGFYDRGEESKQ